MLMLKFLFVVESNTAEMVDEAASRFLDVVFLKDNAGAIDFSFP